ncbi:MAG: tRNA pseudouridine(55) synthase TruB [Clostridia bacterium]
MISGILNINKPAGITSHDVVAVVRKIFKGTKVGHTGTLDPLATGVLPICIGKATKLSDKLTSKDKEYRVKMLLGIETDSYDITGKVVAANAVNVDEIYVRERIKRFIGKQMQKPPIYSAIKKDGKKLYEYAREGKTIDIPEREIEIFSIENINLDLEKNEVSFDVHCTKGTYIRSLVHDIGQKIGCYATMTELIRLKSGDFKLKDSIELTEYIKLDYLDMLKKVVTIEQYYRENKRIVLENDEVFKFLNAVSIDMDSSDKLVRVYNNNKFIGIGDIKDNKLKRYLVED